MVCTFTILSLTSAGGLATAGSQAIKNRPEHGFGRDQDFAVPGLFSELFNVAASRPAQMTTEQRKISPTCPFRQDKRCESPSLWHQQQTPRTMFSLLSRAVFPIK